MASSIQVPYRLLQMCIDLQTEVVMLVPAAWVDQSTFARLLADVVQRFQLDCCAFLSDLR